MVRHDIHPRWTTSPIRTSPITRMARKGDRVCESTMGRHAMGAEANRTYRRGLVAFIEAPTAHSISANEPRTEPSTAGWMNVPMGRPESVGRLACPGCFSVGATSRKSRGPTPPVLYCISTTGTCTTMMIMKAPRMTQRWERWRTRPTR